MIYRGKSKSKSKLFTTDFFPRGRRTDFYERANVRRESRVGQFFFLRRTRSKNRINFYARVLCDLLYIKSYKRRAFFIIFIYNKCIVVDYMKGESTRARNEKKVIIRTLRKQREISK